MADTFLLDIWGREVYEGANVYNWCESFMRTNPGNLSVSYLIVQGELYQWLNIKLAFELLNCVAVGA